MMERDRITGFYFIWGSVDRGDWSQHPNIQSRSDSDSDLTLDHTKRPVMTFTRPGPRVTSWSRCRLTRRRWGVIMGSSGEHYITLHNITPTKHSPQFTHHQQTECEAWVLDVPAPVFEYHDLQPLAEAVELFFLESAPIARHFHAKTQGLLFAMP